MSAVRPLPPTPNLEFEHKQAKAFLRRLRAGDPDALARAHAQQSTSDTSAAANFRLADAQLMIAREYGFASWPKLARYYGDVHRQSYNLGSVQYSSREFYDANVGAILDAQRGERMRTKRLLAAYVPRFYGIPVEDIDLSGITEDEARLAVARSNGFASWDVLLDRCGSEPRKASRGLDIDPIRDAAKAIEAVDVAGLERAVERHPDLLQPSERDVVQGRSLQRLALDHERVQGQNAMRPIMDWLAAKGLDLQQELNRQLCGHMYMKSDKVLWLIERGADPSWIAPNGISVLEHALIRYWNGDAVDVVAARCSPRKALWIAAGLGDIDGVRRLLNGEGKPTADAKKLRPDFDAVGPRGMLSHPDPEDEEILMEAFFIAALNGRTAVLEYMVSRGLPLNSLVWGTPVINVAAGNAWLPVVECLLKCGADPNLTGWGTRNTARDIARNRFEDDPQNANLRRLVEMLGMDPDVIIAERDMPA